jgi:hypothetical protein
MRVIPETNSSCALNYISKFLLQSASHAVVNDSEKKIETIVCYIIFTNTEGPKRDNQNLLVLPMHEENWPLVWINYIIKFIWRRRQVALLNVQHSKPLSLILSSSWCWQKLNNNSHRDQTELIYTLQYMKR